MFDQEDFVAAFIAGGYLAARRSAVRVDLACVGIAASDFVHSTRAVESTSRLAIPLIEQRFGDDSRIRKDS